MQLSKRLAAIYAMIEDTNIVADIGCDHAFLACELLRNNKARKVYACDVNQGPLNKAMETIERYALQEQVIPLLSDGLHNVPRDCDSIVIAGMGFETIKKIIEDQFDFTKNMKQIILQSNTHVDELRKWMNQKGFNIINEDIVEEGFFYQIISFRYGEIKEISEEEVLFGCYLDQHPLFISLWSSRLDKLHNIIKNIQTNQPKYKELTSLIALIENKIKKPYK